ncbi:hypothetical protein MRX96_045182 [Rhipicephalus microplus]
MPWLLICGDGRPATFARNIYEIMNLSTKNCALLTSKLQEPQWRLIDQDDHCTIRMDHGMPHGSPVADTFAEVRAWSASLMVNRSALCYLERLQRASDAGFLLERLSAASNTLVDQLLDVYDGFVADNSAQSSLSPPPDC